MAVGIPKGMRDFSPEVLSKRNYIFDEIKKVYSAYGYRAIETPAMEKLSVLTGKYGDEGDKLLFKVLNSGDFLKKANDTDLQERKLNKLIPKLCSRGLRYDLTVPFARYVVQHRNEISFPFKRYQIQPVWRADRPQKGRYREFYQCDADIIGSNTMLNELEIVQMIDEVFTALNLQVSIKINNRKLLNGIAEFIGKPEKFSEITAAIDKVEKIGTEKVFEELQNQGLSKAETQKLQPFLELKGDFETKIAEIKKTLEKTPSGKAGIEETEELFSYIRMFSFNNHIELDLSLARGLNYYTGAIFEVKSNEVPMGSICGGGRYDDLTGIFGMKDVSGVGISFGADRIYDVLEKLGRFPEQSSSGIRLMFTNFGEREAKHGLRLLAEIRKLGISAIIYPDASKLKKQMKFANNNNIPYVVLVGEDELNSGKYTLKNMGSGEQQLLDKGELIRSLNPEKT